jgi:hypothetical protein
MLRQTRLLRAAVIAVALLGALTTPAAAYSSLVIERGGAIRQVSEGKITFEGGIVSVACNLTLTGELEPTLAGELPILAGRVTSLTWSECTGGNINEILGLPWAVRIESRSAHRWSSHPP